jgi:hypothetical protein
MTTLVATARCCCNSKELETLKLVLKRCKRMQSLRISEKLVNTAVRVAHIFVLTRVISALAAEMTRMHAYYLGVIPIEKSGTYLCAGQPRQ